MPYGLYRYASSLYIYALQVSHYQRHLKEEGNALAEQACMERPHPEVEDFPDITDEEFLYEYFISQVMVGHN